MQNFPVVILVSRPRYCYIAIALNTHIHTLVKVHDTTKHVIVD